MTTEIAAPTCEARVGWRPGEYAELPIWCSAVTALTTWTDLEGRTHRACRHHLAALLRRNPEATPRARCYFCERDLADGLYIRVDFGKTVGIQNVCDICEERSDDGPDNTAAGHEHWDDGR